MTKFSSMNGKHYNLGSRQLEHFAPIFVSGPTSAHLLNEDLVSGTMVCEGSQAFVGPRARPANDKHSATARVRIDSPLITANLSVAFREDGRTVRIGRWNLCFGCGSWPSVRPLCGHWTMIGHRLCERSSWP